jgi:cytochrome c556
MRQKLSVMAVCAAVVFGLTVRADEKPTEAYQSAMKALGGANQGLRNSVPAKDYAAIEQNAATFKASFATALAFWTEKKADDAIKLATDGAKGAADLEAAAKARNDDGIAAAQKAIGATCAACHMAHRSGQQGAYEIK